MARRTPPRKVTYFEPVPPRLARNTIIESTFEVGLEELAAGRARSLRELAERDGITRRYVRRLVDLAFLSPEPVEAILHGRQPVELTATRLTKLDLPLSTGPSSAAS
jgi:hypothetical protein